VKTLKSEIRNLKSEVSALGADGRSAPVASRRILGPWTLGFFRISDFGFRISVFLALFLAAPAAHACTVCFGNSDSKLSQGMLAGVLVLLLVVLAVLGGFVALFIFLARKAAAAAALDNASTESKA